MNTEHHCLFQSQISPLSAPYETAILDEGAAAVDVNFKRPPVRVNSDNRTAFVAEQSPDVLQADAVAVGKCRHDIVARCGVVEVCEHGQQRAQPQP